MSIVDILLGLGLFSSPISLWKINSDAVLDDILRSDICGVDYDYNYNTGLDIDTN